MFKRRSLKTKMMRISRKSWFKRKDSRRWCRMLRTYRLKESKRLMHCRKS